MSVSTPQTTKTVVVSSPDASRAAGAAVAVGPGVD